MNEWFIASSEEIKSSPKMDSSCRHISCHNLISSSTINQSFVFTAAFSTSPFFSLALGLRLGRCRSAPSPSLLFCFLFYPGRSPPSACSVFSLSPSLAALIIFSQILTLSVTAVLKLGVSALPRNRLQTSGYGKKTWSAVASSSLVAHPRTPSPC